MKWGKHCPHDFTSVEQAARHALKCEDVTAAERDMARHQLMRTKIAALNFDLLRARTPTDRLEIEHKLKKLEGQARRLFRKVKGIKSKPMPPEVLERLKKGKGKEG